MIPPRLFRNRTITLAVVASIAVGVGMFGASIFLGQYFQISRGESPTMSGLMTLPMILGLLVASTWSGGSSPAPAAGSASWSPARRCSPSASH